LYHRYPWLSGLQAWLLLAVQQRSSPTACCLIVDGRTSTLSRHCAYEDRTFNRDQLEVFGY